MLMYDVCQFFLASITMYFQNGRKCFSLKRLICETSLNMTSVSCFTARSRWIRFWSKKHVRKNHLLVATFNYYRHNQLVALDELCLCKKLGINNVNMYNYIIHTTFWDSESYSSILKQFPLETWWDKLKIQWSIA